MIRSLVPSALAACLAGADLAFDATAVDVFPEPGMATAVASFTCRNRGTAPVRVTTVEYGCTCTGWKLLLDGHPTSSIPPGAQAVFELSVGVVGGSQGRQWKSATFVCAGRDGEERHTLRFSYDTGAAIQLSRKCLYWDIGEAGAAKTTAFAVSRDEKPIRITALAPKNDAFTVELRTLEAGRSYQLIATPRSTGQVCIGSVLVTTDSPYEAWRSFTVFLLVTRVQH